MFFLLKCVIAIVAFLALFDFIRVKFRYKKYLKNIPADTYIPLIGHLWLFTNVEDAFYIAWKMFFSFGHVVRLNFLSKEILIVKDPKLTREVLTNPKFLNKSLEYNVLHEWLGQGLLTSTGERWQKDRKFLTPAFHFNNLLQLSSKFNSTTGILIDKLRKDVGKPSVELQKYITLCTLDIICESIMGISINAQTSKNSEYVKSVEIMKNTVYRRNTAPWKLITFLYPISKDYWQEQGALKVLHGVTDRVIRERRQYLVENPNVIGKNLGKCKSFLDMLLVSEVDGKTFNDQEIRQQVDTFMFEGHDTTAISIGLTLFSLAENQHVQNKVYDEIKAILGTNKTCTITHQQLSELNYLGLVIKEGLRHFPAVPTIGRTLTEDVEFDGVLYPKDLSFVISIYGIQKRYDLFPKCEEFIPERFVDEQRTGEDPYSYIPFSAGFRNCIGQRFALLELKSVIARILLNFKIYPVEDYKLTFLPNIILMPKDGILVRLEER